MHQNLSEKIESNEYFAFTKSQALEIVKSGLNAGDGYGEVWIRDYNTFIELSAEVYAKETLKENLRVFLRLQGEDGNIVDGFIPKEKATQTPNGYAYILTDLEPDYAGHKNTMETDHESSLVQAVYKYVKRPMSTYSPWSNGSKLTGAFTSGIRSIINPRDPLLPVDRPGFYTKQSLCLKNMQVRNGFDLDSLACQSFH
ncbi:MAG: hypothetical protein EA353_05505 [Puniceicoccaceae bacterium]|nr:MAG: hypothetical protein EA353_05505 [Puniceicoccaceae bacterium]